MTYSPGKAPTRARGRGDGGFTIVEMLIALVLASVMFLALGFTLTRVMSGTADSRRNQQAADFISERMEAYRGGDYASVAIRTPGAGAPALTSDPKITGTAGNYKFDPDDAGPLATEQLLVDPAGVVTQKESVVRDGTHFDIASYVTVPSDASASPYKRLTTIVTWLQGGFRHQRRATTYVAETQRGLPLPDFLYKNEDVRGTSITVAKNAQLNLFVGLTNRGARDSWKITVAAPGTGWSFDRYQVDQPNDAITGITALTGGDTAGPIATDDTWHLMAQLPNVTGGTGGPFAVTIRATSVAQPSIYKEVIFNVTVVNDVCSGGCTYVPIYLHNTTTSAGCTGSPCTDPSSNRITTDLYADRTLPKWAGTIGPPDTTAPDFDKDYFAGPGRVLVRGGVIATEPLTSGKAMQWKWDATSAVTTVLSTKSIALTLCAKDGGNGSGSPDLTMQLLASKTSGSPQTMTTATVSLGGLSTTAFSCFVINSTLLAPATGGNWLFKSTGSPSAYFRKMTLKITAPNIAASDIVLAYDSTTFPSAFEVPTP